VLVLIDFRGRCRGTCAGMEVWLQAVLILVLGGSELSDLLPGHFTRSHWIRGYKGGQGNALCCCRTSNSIVPLHSLGTVISEALRFVSWYGTIHIFI